MPIGSVLRIRAEIVRREGARKVWVAAQITDPESGAVHAEGDGLFLRNKEEAGAP